MEVFHTSGTCSRQIIFKVDEQSKISDVKFIGGCAGNLQGISRLIEGMHIDDVITRLSGILCKGSTSCPDQLSKALVAYKRKLKDIAEGNYESIRRR